MLINANLLLYTVDRRASFTPAMDWLTKQLNGPRRVGLPWQSLVAFVRISTHPRASTAPLDSREAGRHVEDWLASDVAWVPRLDRNWSPVAPTKQPQVTSCRQIAGLDPASGHLLF